MNGDALIKLLGLTYDDERVKLFLDECKIKKKPKLPHGDLDAYLENEKLGIEFTFTDERYLDVKSKEYEDGSLVLSNICLYGDDETFNRYAGDLPLGLKFDFGLKETKSKLGEPAWENKDMGLARWDFKDYCVFVTFDEEFKEILDVAVQLPVK